MMNNIVNLKREELTNKIVFKNKGLIDLRAIKTFGVSSKENKSAIGYFGTGLKYAIAVLLREGIFPTIYIGEKKYTFTKRKHKVRVNDFEFIYMNRQQLPFTTELGKNWELWQAFRELYCNCTDEHGRIYKTVNEVTGNKEETTIIIDSKDFEDVFDNKDSIILNSEPIIRHDFAEIHAGQSECIYYKGVRIYEKPTKYTYNITTNGLDITEDRTAKYEYQLKRYICDLILLSSDKSFIKDCVVKPEVNQFFENLLDFDCSSKSAGDIFIEVVKELVEKRTPLVEGAMRKAKVAPALILPKPCQLTDLEKKALNKAESFLTNLIEVGKYKVIVTDNFDIDQLGEAKNEKIYLSRRVFSLGLKEIIRTYYEEYLHLKTGYEDMTREMQNYLFEKIIDQQAIIQNEVL